MHIPSFSNSQSQLPRRRRSCPSTLLRHLPLAGLILATLPVTVSAASWWNNAWLYRVPVTVQNASISATLPVRYSARLVTDVSLLVQAGQALPSCADLRLIYFDGVANYELDRVINNCATGHAEIWFSLQRSIPAGAADGNYFLYYGNPSAGAPLSNGMNVFLFYEDWESGSTHWTGAGGLDPASTGVMGTSAIASDAALSTTRSQMFSQKGAGGDAFSGYIPVSPNTGYAISVWATSATSAYFPVGFDPYSASHGRGSEVWLWTSEWTLSPQWTQRTASFTTGASTAYIKIKDEWWNEGPGTAPVHADNLVLRYALTAEPTVTQGPVDTGR